MSIDNSTSASTSGKIEKPCIASPSKPQKPYPEFPLTTNGTCPGCGSSPANSRVDGECPSCGKYMFLHGRSFDNYLEQRAWKLIPSLSEYPGISSLAELLSELTTIHAQLAKEAEKNVTRVITANAIPPAYMRSELEACLLRPLETLWVAAHALNLGDVPQWEGEPHTMMEAFARLSDLTAWCHRNMRQPTGHDTPPAEEGTSPTAPAGLPTIWYHGESQYSIDGKTPLKVSDEFDCLLQTFLDSPECHRNMRQPTGHDTPPAEEGTSPTAPDGPPTIWYHGESQYSIDGKTPLKVSDEFDCLLQTFLDSPEAMETKEIRKRSGVTNLARAIASLAKWNDGIFGPAIRIPNGKSKGGYFVRVTRCL